MSLEERKEEWDLTWSVRRLNRIVEPVDDFFGKWKLYLKLDNNQHSVTAQILRKQNERTTNFLSNEMKNKAILVSSCWDMIFQRK